MHQTKIYLIALFLVLPTLHFSIDSLPNSYNPSTSKNYAAYASLAYCPKKCIQAWNCKSSVGFPKLVNVSHFNNDVTLAAVYVGYEEISQNIIVSWRGSANAQNWIEDFTIAMEPFSGCKGCYIHVGFHFDYKVNAEKVKNAINALLSQKKVNKIVFTGHSLGAALASINAIYYTLQNSAVPIEVNHFGSPRLGNENLAQFIRMKIPEHFRVVHNRDIVPHLPPEVEYRHAAYEIFFSKDMSEYKVCDESGQDSSCSNKYFPDYLPGDHNFYFMDMDPKC